MSESGYVEALEAHFDRVADALRLTVEYVGLDVLPAEPGWDWFEALEDAPWFPEWLSAMKSRQKVEAEARQALDDLLAVEHLEVDFDADFMVRLAEGAPVEWAVCRIDGETDDQHFRAFRPGFTVGKVSHFAPDPDGQLAYKAVEILNEDGELVGSYHDSAGSRWFFYGPFGFYED